MNDNKFVSFELHNISSFESMDICCVGYTRNRSKLLNNCNSYEIEVIVPISVHVLITVFKIIVYFLKHLIDKWYFYYYVLHFHEFNEIPIRIP